LSPESGALRVPGGSIHVSCQNLEIVLGRGASNLWDGAYKSHHSNDLWALQPISNSLKEIPVRTFNNLVLFEAADYTF
jgi:hypothetical protein